VPEVKSVLRDAALIVCIAGTAGAVANLLRGEGRLAWIQRTPYDILVPCPEPVGDAGEMAPGDPLLEDPRSLVVDARTAAEYSAWHVPNAISIPFDWLGPPLDAEVKTVAQRVAASGATRVVVYGDGDDPDSGREWARLLAGARIRNVSYVKGGGPALVARMTGGKHP
jgi:hypothetical protein